MENHFNVIIIGAGPSGISTAKRLSQKGKSVLVVDNNIADNYLHKGSILSNSILYYSYLYNIFVTKIRNFLKIKEKEIEIELKKLKKQIESIKNKLSKTLLNEIADNDIVLKTGIAKFVAENEIEIDGEKFTFDYAVIATGSKSKELKLNTKINYLTLENFLNHDEIPKSIAVIGGGYVGVEIAVIFRRFGSEVTIIEKNDRLLRDFDSFIVKKFEDSLKKGGINIIKEAEVEKVEKIGNKTIIFLQDERKVETNEVFIAIGREPNINNLSLENAGVKIKDGKIKINRFLQTSNEKIYVVGDATGFNMFVNWSYKSSEIVADNILGLKRDYRKIKIPKVIYADPEIASVGLTEEQAKEKKLNYDVIKYTFADIEKSVILGHGKGIIKIIYNKSNQKIVGVSIVGKGAVELINIFGIMIQLNFGLDKIKACIFNNPLFASILTDISEAIMGKCCDSNT